VIAMIHKIPPRPVHDASGSNPEPPDHLGTAYKPQISSPDGGHPDGSDQGCEKGSYCVGYGRPPLHSRFKPGQLGNPKGRPKQSRNLRTIVKQVFDEQMPIREGGRLRRMPAIEALLRTLLVRAFKGDLKAMSSLIVLFRQSGYGADQDEGAADTLLAPEYEAIIADFMVRHNADRAANADVDAAKAGSPPSATPKDRKG
jgi:Family of unknown function (DUF5681)